MDEVPNRVSADCRLLAAYIMSPIGHDDSSPESEPLFNFRIDELQNRIGPTAADH
jgi:hypothetical protein